MSRSCGGGPAAMLRWTTLCKRLPGCPGKGASPVVTDFRLEIALKVKSRMFVGWSAELLTTVVEGLDAVVFRAAGSLTGSIAFSGAALRVTLVSRSGNTCAVRGDPG